MNSKDVPAAGTFLARARQGIANPTKTAIRLRKQEAVFHSAEQAGHFLVVNNFDKAAGKVYIFDPQEGRHYILTVGQLEREWSGAGLMLASRPGSRVGKNDPAGLPRLALLSPSEMDRYVGGCCGVPGSGGPGGPNGPGKPCGSPVWSVNPVTLNLNVYDIPLWYAPAVGPQVEVSMSYNSLDALNQNLSFGNKWSFGYGSYLVEDTTAGGGNVVVFTSTGVQDDYVPIPGSGNYQPRRPENHNTLAKVGVHRFFVTKPSGTVDVYDIPTGINSMQPFLVERRDKFGYKLTFGYNADVELTTITDAQGKLTTLNYDSEGHITSARTPYGQEATFAYDKNGNMVQVVDIEGNAFGYVYDSDIRMTELDTAQGPCLFKHEGPDGNPGGGDVYPAPGALTWFNMRVTITDPMNQSQEYFYRGGGALLPGDPVNAPEGNKYFYVSPRFYKTYVNAGDNNSSPSVPKTQWETYQTIDNFGKITRTVLPSTDGGQTYLSSSVHYDVVSGLPDSITDTRGRTTKIARNSKGNVTDVTDWRGRTSTLVYAPNGIDVVKTIGVRGDTLAEMTYTNPVPGAAGVLTSITFPPVNPGDSERVKSFTYTSWGVPATMTDYQGTSTYTYDSNGCLSSLSHNGNQLATFTYDNQQRLVSQTDSGGKTLTISYDELNHSRRIGFSDGTSIESQSICCGIPGLVKDRSGRITYYDYDSLKRLVRVQDAAGGTVQMDYNPDGNLSQIIDSKGNESRFQYDTLGRLIAQSYPDGSVTRSSYDSVGRLAARQDASGRIVRYQYDDNDRVIKIDYPNQPDVTYSYDSLDRVAKITDGVGNTTFGYDGTGHLNKVDGPFPADTLTYGFDDQSRPAWQRINNGNEVDYYYDSWNRLNTINTPAGNFTAVYNDFKSQLHDWERPDGTKTTLCHDALGRLQQVSDTGAGDAVLWRNTYEYESGTYSDQGMRTGQTEEEPGVAPRQVSYGYSADSQLTSENSQAVTGGGGEGLVSPPEYGQSFAYDGMGNRTTASLQNAGGTTSISYNAASNLNQLTGWDLTDPNGDHHPQQLSYNGNGQVVTRQSDTGSKLTYEWNDAGQISAAETRNDAGALQKRAEWTYDFAGRKRICREYIPSIGGGNPWQLQKETDFVYSGLDVVQERVTNVTGGVSTAGPTTTYTRLGRTLLAKSVLAAGGTTPQHFYFHQDGNNNIVGLTNSTGSVVARYSYDAFGNLLSSAGSEANSNAYRWAGQPTEPVAQAYNFGFRFYAPDLGRWMSRDPLGESQGLNLYKYCRNRPVDFTDLYGLSVQNENRDWFSNTTDFVSAWGSKLTFGATDKARQALGNAIFGDDLDDEIDTCSGWYKGGGVVGQVHQAALLAALGGGGAAATAGEVGGPAAALADEGAAGAAENSAIRQCLTDTGCFAPGTLVMMADGSTKAIERIKPGDTVLTKDNRTGKLLKKKVVHSW